MIRLSRAFALLLVVWPVADSVAETPFGAREGLIVLRNGRVLSGSIVQVGDEYRLSYPNGDEVRLPVSAVELYCRSLQEAYELKRFAIAPQNTHEHLDLADWCVTQGLHEQAVLHLEHVENLDPDESRVAFIRRRITYANQPRPTTSAAAIVEQPPADSVDIDDPDDIIGRLPSIGVETFTTHIQPLLVNRCGAGGCHGQASKSDFRLVRTSSGQVMSRKFTQRNLLSAWQQIDLDHPQDSPLLKLPLGPHGSADRAIFSQVNRKQHDLLVEWVNIVTQKPDVAPPAKIGLRDAHNLQAPGIQRPAFSRDAPGAESKQPSAADTTMNNLGIEFAVKPAKFESALDEAFRPNSSFTPIDSFDPDIFNRRFLPAAQDKTVDESATEIAKKSGTEKESKNAADDREQPSAGYSLIPFRKNSPRASASRK